MAALAAPAVLAVLFVLVARFDGLPDNSGLKSLGHHEADPEEHGQQPGEHQPEFGPTHSSIRCEGRAVRGTAGRRHYRFCQFANPPTRRIHIGGYT